eukprot:EG_transcript_1095
MRLAVIFLATLAVSVILSSTATWGLTYTTSYRELQDMSSGFVQLAKASVDEFGQLVWQLIGESGDLVSGILDASYAQSVAQLNETGLQFLQTTRDLMLQAKNTTAQTQGSVVTLLLSFQAFMQVVIGNFKAVGTDSSSRLRVASASQAQAAFHNMMEASIQAIQRQAQLYQWGMLNLSRTPDQPLDDGTCTMLGELCSTSAEVNREILIGTAAGNYVDCSQASRAIAWNTLFQNATTVVLTALWIAPYRANDVNANLSAWKQKCLSGISDEPPQVYTCPKGPNVMLYPNQCNGTCGYDPRCRPWYTVHEGVWPPRTQMSVVYYSDYLQQSITTLSYPIHSKATSPPKLMGVTAMTVLFGDMEADLATLGTAGASQVVAVVLNSSALTVVGSSRGCPNGAGRPSGKPMAQGCDPVLQGLSGWLAANRGLQSNVSLEVNGTVWDVFPDVVDSFSYFVVVGMNITELFATVTTTTQAAQSTLQNLSQQQSDMMAASQAAALAQIDAVSAEKVAALQAKMTDLQRYTQEAHVAAAQSLNASHQRSADALGGLIGSELGAIRRLQDYHLDQVAQAIGTTFGAVVGVFVGILLAGAYGTWRVTTQVQDIATVMEDVAHMRVEELRIDRKSSVQEVQRIEGALGVLVQRLAEYKSYMPAALFQPQDGEEPKPVPGLPASPTEEPANPRRGFSERSKSTASTAVTGSLATRLMRRSAAVMAVNVVAFQAELTQRSAAHVEALLNRFISTVHRVASQAQGNLDAVVGDQILVTFNAHFACSDPLGAASGVALELVGLLKDATSTPQQVQVGLATGHVYAGHLGYAPFKSMLAVGAPLKVATLLAHLSGFAHSVVLVSSAVEERVKYSFKLRPADLVALPNLGDCLPAYARSVTVHVLEAHVSSTGKTETQEWMYEVTGGQDTDDWATTFGLVAKAPALAQAQAHLEAYLKQHPADPLPLRLLARLPRWRPQVGVVLAERPDGPDQLRAATAPSSIAELPDLVPC